MPRPFSRDWQERRQWWDEHLGLQMVLIFGICLLALVIVYGPSLIALAAAGAITVVLYLVTRWLLR